MSRLVHKKRNNRYYWNLKLNERRLKNIAAKFDDIIQVGYNEKVANGSLLTWFSFMER